MKKKREIKKNTYLSLPRGKSLPCRINLTESKKASNTSSLSCKGSSVSERDYATVPIYFSDTKFARQSCPIRRIDSSTFRASTFPPSLFSPWIRKFASQTRGIRRFLGTGGGFDLSTPFVGTVTRYSRQRVGKRSKWLREMDVPRRNRNDWNRWRDRCPSWLIISISLG